MTVALGLLVAAAAWGFLFGLVREGLWARAPVAGAAIGGYALVAQWSRLDDLLRPTAADVVLGLVAAPVLYGVFVVGDRVLRRFLPALSAQVDDLYLVGSVPGSRRLAISVAAVVTGCAEELFWRGFVQRRAGFLLSLACYAAVHLWERKAALVLAALAGGVFWGLLFAWRATLVAPLISHALWDLAAVVWFPVGGKNR